jgi:hypothetical protein
MLHNQPLAFQEDLKILLLPISYFLYLSQDLHCFKVISSESASIVGLVSIETSLIIIDDGLYILGSWGIALTFKTVVELLSVHI